MTKSMVLVLALATMAGCAAAQGGESGSEETTGEAEAEVTSVPAAVQKARVGRQLYFDTNLSSPAGQSCASCHDPNAGFADPDANVPTSEGVIPGRFGNRNTPTAAYAQYIPAAYYDATDEVWVGGQFWDGRASTLEDQAKGPFLNPIEMNNPDKASVVAKVRASVYAPLFRDAFGPTSLDDVETAYDHIAEAIAAFERTPLFAPAMSKYDFYLAGKATLTAAQARGLALFLAPNKGNCAACHPAASDTPGVPPMFTDFTYDNLGVPKNSNNPFYNEPAFNPLGASYDDRGLGAVTGDASLDGAFKVPTLRNLGRTGPYMHNGAFSTLKQVVHFYNTRDVAGAGWAAPELAATMNTEELGNLGLTGAEEDDIVAFLGTLNDARQTGSVSCSTTRYYAVNNAEFPAHEPGLCGAQEYLFAEAFQVCGGYAVGYFSYACTNGADGTHVWTAYFGCCGG
jgi:cytochrome c peroxidase